MLWCGTVGVRSTVCLVCLSATASMVELACILQRVAVAVCYGVQALTQA
jgi:hypothetical protein